MTPPLEPLPWQKAIVETLRTHEPALWDWFSSVTYQQEQTSEVRLELLRSAYRLDEAAHPELHARASAVLGALGLEVPLTFYQAHGAPRSNAALCYLPGEAHLVLSGSLLSHLGEAELASLIAHEMAHFVLWNGWGGSFRVADQLLRAMAAHPEAAPSHVRTCRLNQLYSEIFADRGPLAAGSSPGTAIATLLKVETGLAEVSVDSYLGQVEEILATRDGGTAGVTHPELHVRARALSLWSDRGVPAEPEIARLIEGPPALDTLDLVQQHHVTGLTRELMGHVLSPPAVRSEALVAHARLFFPDFALTEGGADLAGWCGAHAPHLTELEEYVVYVLLDFAAADPGLEEVPLAAAFRVATGLGVADRFHEVARRELGLKVRDLKRVREDADSILAAGARQEAS